MSELIEDLAWRGLIAQTTDLDRLNSALDSAPLTLYCGFDPTAPSLHVGNLVPLLVLRRFQNAGHRPIGLVGGATGLIGDPSGRREERELNADDVVAQWVEKIQVQVAKFIDLKPGPAQAHLVSNLDWTKDLGAIAFLRDIGKHFSVNVMLSKDSISSRLAEQGISYTEFSYLLLQAYDYLELFRRHNCRLQIGGSDQWGNITAGLDLIRRVEGSDAPDAHALTVPLVTKTDGTKFGKTAGGAVWLDPSMTSPYAFYQFWLNTDDRDVTKLLRFFSLKSRGEIEAIEQIFAADPSARRAQRELATELTELVHGADAVVAAQATATALFGHGDLSELAEATVDAALSEAPNTDIRLRPSDPAPSIVDLFVAVGLCESKGAARRVIKEGGAYLNNERVIDSRATASIDQLIHGKWWVLRRGRKAFGGVRVSK